MTKRVVGTLGLLIGALLVFPGPFRAPGWFQTASVDRESLKEEWQGEWSQAQPRPAKGTYFLRIHRVESDKVYGQVQVAGERMAGPGAFPFVGPVSGSILVSTGPAGTTQLTIAGTQMQGAWEMPGVHRTVSVTKRP